MAFISFRWVERWIEERKSGGEFSVDVYARRLFGLEYKLVVDFKLIADVVIDSIQEFVKNRNDRILEKNTNGT